MKTLWALYREHSEYGYPDILYGLFDTLELATLVKDHLEHYARNSLSQHIQRPDWRWTYYHSFYIEEIDLYSATIMDRLETL